MTTDSDPRVLFAAERTMLAWLRTGIASIGLGFVVARFGYVLRLVDPDIPRSLIPSATIGIALILIGAAMMSAAAWQQERFLRTLTPSEWPRRYSPRLAIAFALLLAFCGLALAVYLASTSNGRASATQAGSAVVRQGFGRELESAALPPRTRGG